jgi:hypothetical protein
LNQIDEFNKRETLFEQKESEYPELMEMIDEFKPYWELIGMGDFIFWKMMQWKEDKFYG